jgi:hypothetical protein
MSAPESTTPLKYRASNNGARGLLELALIDSSMVAKAFIFFAVVSWLVIAGFILGKIAMESP